MIKKGLFVTAIASGLLLLLFTEGISQNGGVVRIIDTEGTGIIVNNDIDRARKDAIRDALQRAVENVVITFIPGNIAAEKSLVIKDGIYAKYEDYIRGYRIIDERQVRPHYKVAIKSKVSVSDIEDHLRSLGVSTAVMKDVASTTVVIMVRGIGNYADYAKVGALLKNRVNGVRNFQPQRLEHGMARMILNVQGRNIRFFADEIMKTGHFSLDSVSTDQNHIAVTFLKQR